MKVDEITTWLAIQALCPAVLYTYRIDLPKQNIEAIAGDLKNVTTQNACNNRLGECSLMRAHAKGICT